MTDALRWENLAVYLATRTIVVREEIDARGYGCCRVYRCNGDLIAEGAGHHSALKAAGLKLWPQLEVA